MRTRTKSSTETVAIVPMAKPTSGAPPWLRMTILSIKTLVIWAAIAAAAYLAAGAVFFLETRPFGIGILCASGGAGAIAALLGCTLAVQSDPDTALIYTAVYVGVFFVRTAATILFHPDRFPPPRAFYRESVGTRTAIAVFASLALGTYELIVNGYLYYDVFRMAFFAMTCAIFTAYLSGGFRRSVHFGAVSGTSVVALLFLAQVLLGQTRIGGVHVGLILALMAVLYTAKNFGAFSAAAMGLLLSLPLEMGFSADGISAVTVLGAVGISAGAFFGISPYLALSASAVAGLGTGVMLGGFEGLLSVLPEILSTTVIMYPLLKYDILPAYTEESEAVAAPVREMQIRSTEETLTMLSKTFTALSELASGLARGRKRERSGSETCVAACESLCKNCTAYRTCWGEHRVETEAALLEMTETLRLQGKVKAEQAPAVLTARCGEVSRMVSALSEAYRRPEVGSALRQNSPSLHYDVISRLFRRILYEQKEAFALDEAMTAKLRHGIRKARFPTENVTAYGTRKKTIVAEDVQVAGLELGCDDVRRLFENLSGLRLSSPEFSIDGRRIHMMLRTERRFSIESSYKTSMISGESENGDTVTTFIGSDDRFYALISDGMGSGRDAAATSGLCSIFLEQLLTGGNDRETSLVLLNDFIRSREEECSATVDLAEVDLVTGEAVFSKSGAAPTFVRRGGDVFKIQAKTIPMGIARDTDAEHIRFPLKAGDSILMISDGVAAGFEESGWLLRLLDESWVDEPDEMCARILDGAKENNLRTDDMSVCILKIGEHSGA